MEMPSVKLIQFGIIIAAVVAILAAVYMRGRHDVQELWDAERASYAAVLARTIADNKAREAQLQATADAARIKMLEDSRNVEANLNHTIACLRSGRCKLRTEYACANPVPGAAADPARVAGADGTDPVARLAELCFGAAAAGDRAIIQRNACVEILKAERQWGEGH